MKIEELRVRISFQRDIRDWDILSCHVLTFISMVLYLF
jgi:hypothetical protein